MISKGHQQSDTRERWQRSLPSAACLCWRLTVPQGLAWSKFCKVLHPTALLPPVAGTPLWWHLQLARHRTLWFAVTMAFGKWVGKKLIIFYSWIYVQQGRCSSACPVKKAVSPGWPVLCQFCSNGIRKRFESKIYHLSFLSPARFGDFLQSIFLAGTLFNPWHFSIYWNILWLQTGFSLIAMDMMIVISITIIIAIIISIMKNCMYVVNYDDHKYGCFDPL